MRTRTNGHQILIADANSRIRWFRWLLLACTVVSAGCAATSTDRPAMSAHDDQSRDNVLSLTYLCEIRVRTHDELGTRVAQAVEDTLANDGFKLVRHPNDTHDAVLRINVSTQLEKSLFKVYVNGRRVAAIRCLRRYSFKRLAQCARTRCDAILHIRQKYPQKT